MKVQIEVVSRVAQLGMPKRLELLQLIRKKLLSQINTPASTADSIQQKQKKKNNPFPKLVLKPSHSPRIVLEKAFMEVDEQLKDCRDEEMKNDRKVSLTAKWIRECARKPWARKDALEYFTDNACVEKIGGDHELVMDAQIELFACLDDALKAKILAKRMWQSGASVTSQSCLALMGSLCRSNDVEAARSVLKDMEMNGPMPRVVHYHVLIPYLYNNLSIVDEMMEKQVQPNGNTFSYLYAHCTSLEQVEAVWNVHKGIRSAMTTTPLMDMAKAFIRFKNGLDRIPAIMQYIQGCCRMGSIDAAASSVINVAISSMARSKQPVVALNLAAAAKQNMISTTSASIQAVLHAHLRHGDARVALAVYKSQMDAMSFKSRKLFLHQLLRQQRQSTQLLLDWMKHLNKQEWKNTIAVLSRIGKFDVAVEAVHNYNVPGYYSLILQNATKNHMVDAFKVISTHHFQQGLPVPAPLIADTMNMLGRMVEQSIREEERRFLKKNY